jgi:hypothetical protein
MKIRATTYDLQVSIKDQGYTNQELDVMLANRPSEAKLALEGLKELIKQGGSQ